MMTKVMTMMMMMKMMVMKIIGTLRSNDATATRALLKK